MTDERPIYLEDGTAGAYLTQSRDALLDCGNPGRLYAGWRHPSAIEVRERILRDMAAQDRQIEFARTSILFSALSAEAYINGFLAGRLEGADYDAVERMRTPDKYVLGLELASGAKILDRPASARGDRGAPYHQCVAAAQLLKEPRKLGALGARPACGVREHPSTVVLPERVEL